MAYLKNAFISNLSRTELIGDNQTIVFNKLGK